VIDDFIDRIMHDDQLNKDPAVNEAHHRVSPAGFKYLVTEMVCWAAVRPQQCSGRPMGDAHRHLGITEDELVSFMDDCIGRWHGLRCRRRRKPSLWPLSRARGMRSSLPCFCLRRQPVVARPGETV
jgi:hypothetical protein